jgi:hypothetical protein
MSLHRRPHRGTCGGRIGVSGGNGGPQTGEFRRLVEDALIAFCPKKSKNRISCCNQGADNVSKWDRRPTGGGA